MEVKTQSADLSATVIYVDLDDEVTTIFERVRKARGRQIILVIPTHAQIIQSLVNLKILKYKSSSEDKEVTLVTKDAAGRQLALDAGFSTAERVETAGSKVRIEKWIPGTRAEIDTVLEKQKGKAKIGRKILTITETITNTPPEKIERAEIPLGRPAATAKKILRTLTGGTEAHSEEGDTEKFVVRPPSRFALTALLVSGFLLLFFVIYIAVPTATIYVTPRADPISKVINVTLTDKPGASPLAGGAHLVPAVFFDTTVTRDMRIGATGEIFEGTSAAGTVTLFNKSPKEKFLVPSRLMSVRDKLIFRTTQAVTIPRAIGETPGSVDVKVAACEREDLTCDCINAQQKCRGSFVGARGNIQPAFFTLPAIPSLSPTLYWAESKQPFTGGITKVRKFITKEDIANVRATIEREVPLLAKTVLKELTATKAATTGEQLVVLEGKQAIAATIINLVTPQNITDKEIDEFTVKVTVRIRGLAYEDDAVRALLLTELEKAVHPEKKLKKIDFERAALHIDAVTLDEHFAKLSIAVDGMEEFNLSEFTEDGARMVSKIRTRVLGKSVAETENYIRNLPEISNANVSSWPFWARTIPELPENVKFKVRK